MSNGPNIKKKVELLIDELVYSVEWRERNIAIAKNQIETARRIRQDGNIKVAARFLAAAAESRQYIASNVRTIATCRSLLLEACHD